MEKQEFLTILEKNLRNQGQEHMANDVAKIIKLTDQDTSQALKLIEQMVGEVEMVSADADPEFFDEIHLGLAIFQTIIDVLEEKEEESSSMLERKTILDFLNSR